MTIIKMIPSDNGGHENQTTRGDIPVPAGWAVLPPEVGTPATMESFPFGDIAVDASQTPVVVTGWTPGTMPEPSPAAPTTEERIAALEEENTLLQAQIAAQSDQMDFYEECIAEMAMVVYA